MNNKYLLTLMDNHYYKIQQDAVSNTIQKVIETTPETYCNNDIDIYCQINININVTIINL